MARSLWAHPISRLAAAGLALSSLALAAISSGGSTRSAERSSESAAQSVSPLSVRVVLEQVALRPETLAAAGASARDTQAVLDAASAYLMTHGQELAQLDAKIGADGKAADHASAVARRLALLDQLFTDATSGLDPAVAERLRTLRQNDAWEVPVAMRMASRSEREWVQLREALAAQRIAEGRREPAPGGVTPAVLRARAELSTVEASTNLDRNLQSIRAVWEMPATRSP